MEDELETAIKLLASKITADVKADDAMKFAQAALNLANVALSFETIRKGNYKMTTPTSTTDISALVGRLEAYCKGLHVYEIEEAIVALRALEAERQKLENAHSGMHISWMNAMARADTLQHEADRLRGWLNALIRDSDRLCESYKEHADRCRPCTANWQTLRGSIAQIRKDAGL